MWKVYGVMVGLWVIGAVPVSAQLVPDGTLQGESSIVAPMDRLSDRINGGAIRGINLFHSFQEFNVSEGRGVFFANPVGVENILTRVTGSNPSNILGRLGVLGDGNLFLLNPNGIVFGKNVKLDINGSFLATTAEAIALGDTQFFSAKQPEQSSLLAITPGALAFGQLASQQRSIESTGTLSAGKNLTLAANNLDLQGRLTAGGNMTLAAGNTVRIRDSLSSPFIASALGKMAIQGDQKIDIFALNNAQSALLAGRDIVLRSASAVSGDARYTAYGNFQIETMNGESGGLFSLNDPVIRTGGNVNLDFYRGPSLHILAGGSVDIRSYVLIERPDPISGLNEDVQLANGSTVEIRGRTRPTLDIRAGTTAFAPALVDGDISGFGVLPNVPALSGLATSADIRVGTIYFGDRNALDPATNIPFPIRGDVLLTNQYAPNQQLAGNIQISATQETPEILKDRAIVTLDANQGGTVDIHSKGDISLKGIINTDSSSGTGGNVTLRALGNVTFSSGSLINSSGLLGGNIFITSGGTFSVSDRGGITTTSNGLATGLQGGNISIQAGSVSLERAGTYQTDTNGAVNGGNITIQTQSLSLTGGSEILARTFSQGKAGNIVVTPLDPSRPSVVTIDGYAPFTGLDADGNPNGGFSSGLFTSTETKTGAPPGTGNAGLIFINDITTLNVANGGVLSARSKSNGNSEGIDPFNLGVSFSVLVNVQDLNLTGGGQILAPTYGKGEGGNIFINANNRITITGTDKQYNQRFQDFVTAFLPPNPTLAQIQAEGQKAYNRALTTIDPLSSNSAIATSDLNLPELDPDGVGKPGLILVRAGTVDISDQGAIDSSTFGQKEGGSVGILTQNLMITSGGTITSQTFGSGTAGRLFVKPLDETQQDSASITISGVALYTGIELSRWGNVVVNAIPKGGFSSGIYVSTENPPQSVPGQLSVANGNGGDIEIQTGTLRISDAGLLSARSRSNGNGGKVTLNVNALELTNGGQVITVASEGRDAGSITVDAKNSVKIGGLDPTKTPNPSPNLSDLYCPGGNCDNSRLRFNQIRQDLTQVYTDNPQLLLSTETTSSKADKVTKYWVNSFNGASGLQANIAANPANTKPKAGAIIIKSPSLSATSGGEVATNMFGSGTVGDIEIQTKGGSVVLTGASIFSNVEGGGKGQGGNIRVDTGSLQISQGGSLQALLRDEVIDKNPANNQKGASGDAGVIVVQATGDVSLVGTGVNGKPQTGIFARIGEGADGNTGNNEFAGNVFQDFLSQNKQSDKSIIGSIFIQAATLNLSEGAVLDASTFGKGNAGAVVVLTKGPTNIQSGAGMFSVVGAKAEAEGAGGIVLGVGDLTIGNGAKLSTSTDGIGDGGIVLAVSQGNITLDGSDSGIFSLVGASSNSRAGGIGLQTQNLTVKNGAQINVDNQGQGSAGDIIVQGAQKISLDRNSIITATTSSGKGGNIKLDSSEYSLLRRNSNIRTDAGRKTGLGDGGNITIGSPYVIATPSKDSNITANAVNEKGGKVEFTQPTALFGIAKRPKDSPKTNDITASSDFGIQGDVILVPVDTSFIQNNLNQLTANPIDTNKLLANSCIIRKNKAPQGTFYITGTGTIPPGPNDAPISPYPTGELQPTDSPSPRKAWKLGDPIIEPQAAYQLPNGQLILSRECTPP